MRNLFLLVSSILIITLLLAIFNIDYLRKTDFIGKESIKQIFFYVKKRHLINKYSSCFINNKNHTSTKKILIAGHTYGYPEDDNFSTYPKFLNHLKETALEKYDFAFLAGDIIKTGNIVNKSNKNFFLQVKNEFSNFSNKIYVAPGNHDVGLALKNKAGRNEFLSVFDKNYQKIIINNNLFFVLDSTLEPGNISEEQLFFLKNELNNIDNIKNIFVITHHVIWQKYTKEKIISNVGDKFFSNRNFNDVISLFDELESKIKIFFVAGDIGVLKQKTLIFCEKKDNLYFIATGMGNKRLDNYLKILISSEGKIVSMQPIFY